MSLSEWVSLCRLRRGRLSVGLAKRIANASHLEPDYICKESRGGGVPRLPSPQCAVVTVRVSKVPLNDKLQHGHRVPYVIIRGELNGRLVDLHGQSGQELPSLVHHLIATLEMVTNISDWTQGTTSPDECSFWSESIQGIPISLKLMTTSRAVFAWE